MMTWERVYRYLNDMHRLLQRYWIYSYLIIWWLSDKPAGLAQSVERGTFNPEAKGSSPLFGGNCFEIQ